MKKFFTFSAGVVFLITILFISGCDGPGSGGSDKTVTIYLRSILRNGEKHLLMYDTNDSIAIDRLITTVEPGTTVVWSWEHVSRIKKIDSIYPLKPGGPIFKEKPQAELHNKKFKLKVPDNAPRGACEKYYIEYTHEDSSKVSIDPYIRIED